VKKARKQGNKEARKQGGKETRRQGNKETREQGSKRSGGWDCAEGLYEFVEGELVSIGRRIGLFVVNETLVVKQDGMQYFNLWPLAELPRCNYWKVSKLSNS
jgi:hypothetical protein